MSLSDSDSDDGILSAKPMFTKKVAKKQSATEKRAFNYLDNLLKKGDERIEKKARIQDLQLQEESMGATGVVVKGKPDDGKGDKKGSTCANRGVNSDDDGSQTSNKHEGSSISGTNTMVNKETIDKKFDLDNDEYWTSLQNRSKNATASIKERDRRRQNLRDAIDGVDILRQNSGDGASSSDYPNNLGEVSDREQMMASMGIATGKTTVIGTRKLFGVNHKISYQSSPLLDFESKPLRRGSYDLFQNRNDCVQDIKTNLDALDKPLPRNIDNTTRKLWNEMRIQIVDPIKKAVANDLLPQILEKRRSWGPKSQNGSSVIVMPYTIIVWLIRTSTSGRVVGVDLSLGAYEMMQKLLDHKTKLTVLNSENILKINPTDHIKQHCFHIKNFVSVLESEFGLWTQEGPPPIEHEGDDVENLHNEYFDNNIGLEHALKLGSLAFKCNLIKWDGDITESCSKESWDFNGECVCAITTKLISVLCRCAIDPVFHGCNRLSQAQGTILNAIFDWMEEKFDLIHNSNKVQFHGWIQHTAESAIKLCSNFVTEKTGDGLDSDDKGLLPLALALRTCQMIDQTKENVVRFYAIFSRLAAKVSMKNIVKDWDSKVERNAKALLEDINGGDDENVPVTSAQAATTDPKYLSVATSEVALESINRAGETVTRDGPLFLATVDIVVHCEQMGLMLFHFYANKVDVPVLIYESKAEAGAMCDHFGRLENVCNNLKNQVVCILVDKNMMRVKELLATMGGFYRECKAKAEFLSNRGRGSNISSRRQSSISMYLKEGHSSLDDESSPLDGSQDVNEVR